jgi:hypothetical protein
MKSAVFGQIIILIVYVPIFALVVLRGNVQAYGPDRKLCDRWRIAAIAHLCAPYVVALSEQEIGNKVAGRSDS